METAVLTMPLPLAILDILHSGWGVAAKLAAPIADMRAYIVVLPQTRSRREQPEAWYNVDWALRNPRFVLRNPASITGYEVRYIAHKTEYNEEWGYDTDTVLADKTTRIRRVFMQAESEIETALLPWLTDFSLLRHRLEFSNSSLLNCLEDWEIEQPEQYPHLWEWQAKKVSKLTHGTRRRLTNESCRHGGWGRNAASAAHV